jgi:signal transduction histidine kinase/CheY-like chemotaxis protein
MTTIIHINPDPVIQNQVRQALAHAYQLVSVSDAPTAIQYAAMIQPLVILIDVDIPGLSELTLRLKMFMPKTPILIFADQSTVVTGGDAVLYRPFSNQELRHTVQQLLEQFVPLPSRRTLEHQITSLSEANQRLASLNTISALIGTSLDIDHLTGEILDQLKKIVDFDSATLFLLKGNVLEAAASRGFPDLGQGLNTFPENEYNSAWRVVKNKLPLVIDDVTRSGYWENRPELSRVRSWLGVPLINKDRVVGVLTLDKNEPDAFSESEARYIFTLAFQIATTVENTQLFEAMESQSTRLKLINEVSQELTTILDLGNLYSTLARSLVERLNYDRVVIFTLSPDTECLLLQAYYPDQADNDARLSEPEHYNIPLDLDSGAITEAIKTGRPVLINNITDSTFTLPGMPVRSTLAVAVFVDNKLDAVINVDSPISNCFNDHDLWTLGSLAITTATIIENARLYHNIDSYSIRLQRAVAARSQRLAAIKNISQVISQGVHVDKLLTVVGERVNQIFFDSTDDVVQVATVLLTAGKLHTRVIYQESGSEMSQTISPAIHNHDPQSVVGQVITGAQPLILHNVVLNSLYSSAQVDPVNIRNSLMLAPLITAGKTIGVIMVYTLQPDTFDDADLEILETLAFQVASAVETARLLRKTREMAIVNERTRLARDMHDGVAQNLAYLLLQVDRGLNLVEPDSKLEQQLENVADLLKQNIDELRRNIFDLRPVDLEAQSLFEVLEKFVSEFGSRWRLQTSCTINSPLESVSPEIEQVVFRILQEALSNARKHAACRHIEVLLNTQVNHAQYLLLTVRDDGQGFDPNQLQYGDGAQGLGLISMKERAESVGGTLAVSSFPGRGTQVEVSLPLE